MAKHNLPKQVKSLFDDLMEVKGQDVKKLDELLRVVVSSMVPAEQGGVMHVESMVASKTKNPMVIFTWNDNRGELTPLEARQYAMQILESAEAGVQDAALYRAVTTDLKLDDDTAFRMVTAVRNNRRQFEGGDNA